MIESDGFKLTDIPPKAKVAVPSMHLTSQNSAPMPPSSLIPVEQPSRQPEYQVKPKERLLSFKDQELKSRAKETIEKNVDCMVDINKNPSALEEEVVANLHKSLEISSGTEFPKAKVDPTIKAAADLVVMQCGSIEHDRGVAQENGEFFTADPIEDSAKELASDLKIQKKVVRNRVKAEVAAEFKSAKKRIKTNLEFKAEVTRRILEDQEARQIVSKEAIYSQIIKDRRNKRIGEQRKWLLDNDSSLALPAKESVSSSVATLKQTQKLLRETEQELKVLEHQVRTQIIAEIKRDNSARPHGQKVKIRDNPEIDAEMHRRMSDNPHVKELATRGVSQLQLFQQVKAERKKIQQERTRAQFHATRMAQHQDAVIEQLGIRDSYRYPQGLESDQLRVENRMLQEETRWEELVKQSLAQRLNQRLSSDQIKDYGVQVQADGSIQFTSRNIEKQLTDLARKTVKQFRTSGKILSGSLTKSELTQLRAQATDEVKNLLAQKETRTLEAKRAATELEVAIDLANSKRRESIRKRLGRFITNVKRDPSLIKESLIKLLKNRKVQLTAISGLNAVGMGISGANIISPREAVVASVPSSYWIHEKLGELTDQTSAQNIPSVSSGTPSEEVKLAVERTTAETISAREQDILRKEQLEVRKEAAVAEIAKPSLTLPAVPASIKAPPSSYGKEGRLSSNPNALVIPNLQRDNVVGVGDVNEIGLMDPLIHDTNTKVIRISTSGMDFGYIDQNWSRTIDKIKVANAKGLEPRLVLVDYNLPTLEQFDTFLNNRFKTLTPEEVPKAITFGNELGLRTPENKPKYFNITHESISDPEKGMSAYIARLYKATKELSARTGKNIEFTIPSLGWNYWQVPGNVEKYIDALQKAGVDIHDPDVTFDIHTYAAIDVPFPYDENGPQRVIDYKNLLIEKFGVKDPKISIGELWFGSDYTQDQLYRIIKYFKDDLGVWSLILLPHQGSF